MNAIQLALSTAAHARDYQRIGRLIDAGATSADSLYSVIHDISSTVDTLLFELMLCSALTDYDSSLARAIERKVRTGLINIEDGEMLASNIHSVLWRKLLVDHLFDASTRHFELALESSAAIVKLPGFKQGAKSLELNKRLLPANSLLMQLFRS